MECVAFFCGRPALLSSFFWQPCSRLQLGSKKTRADAVPVAVCMSDVLLALCHSPFLTTLPLLTFFLVSIFPVVVLLVEQEVSSPVNLVQAFLSGPLQRTF